MWSVNENQRAAREGFDGVSGWCPERRTPRTVRSHGPGVRNPREILSLEKMQTSSFPTSPDPAAAPPAARLAGSQCACVWLACS